MNKLTAFILLLICSGAHALSVTGSAPSYKGKPVYLIAYADHITNREVIVARGSVDQEGFFNLSFNPTETGKYILRTSGISSHIFIEPGKDLIVYFPGPDPLKPVTTGYTHFVTLMIDSTVSPLNHNIARLNFEIDRFFDEHYAQIIVKKGKKATFEFVPELKKKFGDINHSFFRDYLRYSIASLEQVTGYSVKYLAAYYIHNNPVLFNNPEYMSFFTQYFNNWLGTFALSGKGYKVKEMINKPVEYKKITAMMKLDSLVRDQQITELVLILGLSELYHDKDYNKTAVIRVLNDIAKNGSTLQHRNTAASVAIRLEKLAPGTSAPTFALKDVNNITTRSEDFLGKPMVINFWTTGCGECIQELKVMKSLEKKYLSKIHFVYIPIDDNVRAQEKVYKNEALEGIKLLNGSDYELREAFDVRAVPLFIVIDAAGNILKYPAHSPSTGLETILHELTR